MSYASPIPCPYPEYAQPGLYTSRALQQFGVAAGDADTTDIGLIGALFDLQTDQPDILSRPDDIYTAAAIEDATKRGARISKTARLKMINRIYGRDFLRPEISTTLNCQMGVACHIPYDPKGVLKNQAIDPTTVKQSPLCDIDGIWPQSAKNAGMRWLFNITGDGFELPTHFFARKPYQLLESDRPITYNRKMDVLRHA